MFNKSMITLIPGEDETLTFRPDSYGLEKEARNPSTAAFRRALKIYNLRDTY